MGKRITTNQTHHGNRLLFADSSLIQRLQTHEYSKLSEPGVLAHKRGGGTPALPKNARFAQKSLVCPNIRPFAQIFGGWLIRMFRQSYQGHPQQEKAFTTQNRKLRSTPSASKRMKLRIISCALLGSGIHECTRANREAYRQPTGAKTE